jgi:hypothetical protein
MGRWLDRLQEFTFSIQHRPGVNHGTVDGLSRQTDDDRTAIKSGVKSAMKVHLQCSQFVTRLQILRILAQTLAWI